MIDTDATGQKKLDDLMKSMDDFEWNEYEGGFFDFMVGRSYAYLSQRQQSMVGRLWDRLAKR